MPHDAFLLLVQGEVGVDYIEPRDQLKPGPHKNVTGTDMGHMVLRDGSLASLPARVAYRIRAPKKSLVLLQTKHSEWLPYAWEKICLTAERRWSRNRKRSRCPGKGTTSSTST